MMAHPDGELATTGPPPRPIIRRQHHGQRHAGDSPPPTALVLALPRDRGITRSRNTEAAGNYALQVTVDLPVLGRRKRTCATGSACS